MVFHPEHQTDQGRIAELERRLEKLERADRLTSASIGSGGLRVRDGGSIVILDESDVEQMRLATEGLTVSGGFEFLDAAGDVRVRLTGRADGTEANLAFRSGPGAQEGGEVLLGTIFSVGTGEVAGHGLLIQKRDGQDLMSVRSLDGGEGRFDLRYFNASESAVRIIDDAGEDRLALNTPAGLTEVWLDEDGLRRPRLPVHWAVGSFGDTVANGQGVRTVAEGYPVRTYPQMRFTYRVNVLSGSPTFRVRLRDTVDDVAILGWQTHSSGGYHTHDVTLLGAARATRLHRLEAEVTSGTGEVRVAVVRATIGLH